MRSTVLAVLASAAIVSAGGCAQNSIEDLVAETSCGSVNAITACLGTADLQRLDEIERCYTSNGCSAGEATVEAVWFAKDCQPLQIENGRGDLKRRADSTDSGSTTSEKTTAKSTDKSTTAKSTTAPSSTTASTTVDSTTSSDSSTTSSATTASSTTSSTTSSSSQSTTGTSSTTSGSTTGSLVCSITSTISTKVCQTTSGTSTCSSTTVESASCAPGLICFSATASANSALCMKRDNTLTTSGLIVTIVFGLAIGVAIIAFIVMGVRNSKKVKQQEYAHQMAAASTKGADVESQSFANANRSEAALPLITPGGTRSDQYQPQQDYFGQSSGGGNSVTPPAGRGNAPQLHQGLGALGQETRY
ncbi:uncharacterized protein LY89DRAFT_691355 [Mollisia scopiformis]|uniref:Uncharacterized protein n=1 Tax=Mollisia scopiformis TaxID=149040 RepID=A0A132B6M3_MOLSC|nr:uncharacterized protein LY89DRAFT_691355 [Mollisia scopiformis]KUJ08055.1 hypothetical protein LY89DRAFT_691355 [Mollisia scopiformis]